jgi:hypothetical protein
MALWLGKSQARCLRIVWIVGKISEDWHRRTIGKLEADDVREHTNDTRIQDKRTDRDPKGTRSYGSVVLKV